MRSVALALSLLSLAHAAMTDPATGIAFKPRINELSIFGVGVRKKGPIKVYSVGMYCSDAIKDALAGLSKGVEQGKQALAAVASGAKSENTTTTFLLEMNFKVGAEKMAKAIADSVAPRHTGAGSEVDQLKELIFQGVHKKGAAVKGTKLQFDCSGAGVGVLVDGNDQGSVESAALAHAFCDVFLDDQTVSPALRTSILDNCCAN